jgi:hypothetical protein
MKVVIRAIGSGMRRTATLVNGGRIKNKDKAL